MNDYKRLCAIVETTEDRVRPLTLEIRGGGEDLILACVVGGKRTLATVPFDPMDIDQSARHLARKLTLDGGLPHGMD